jgi:hypothetical protein
MMRVTCHRNADARRRPRDTEGIDRDGREGMHAGGGASPRVGPRRRCSRREQGRPVIEVHVRDPLRVAGRSRERHGGARRDDRAVGWRGEADRRWRVCRDRDGRARGAQTAALARRGHRLGAGPTTFLAEAVRSSRLGVGGVLSLVERGPSDQFKLVVMKNIAIIDRHKKSSHMDEDRPPINREEGCSGVTRR